ncbi:MAG: DUF3592 domain-containing protein [Propionibacteriaceae bacterium]|jgi:hypothetical protein|nr:DUF3592 domain-containing protein [Propionibacteriaceae bacterium]
MDRKPVRTAGEKTLFLVGAFVTGFGLIFGTLGLLIGLHPWSPDSERETTTATIVDFGASNTVVEYWVDGVRQTARLTESFSGDAIGDTIEVSYDPDDPAKPQSSRGLILIASVMGGIGGTFFLIGLSLLVGGSHRRRRAARLLNEGRQLTGDILGVERNMSVSINNIHPWRILCATYLPGSEEALVSHSPDWMIDPTPIIQAHHITTLPVYVDGDNPHATTAYVDDSALRSANHEIEPANDTFTPITYPTATQTDSSTYPALSHGEALVTEPETHSTQAGGDQPPPTAGPLPDQPQGFQPLPHSGT